MTVLRQEADPGEAGLDAKALERLDGELTRRVDAGELPGSWWPSPARGVSRT